MKRAQTNERSERATSWVDERARMLVGARIFCMRCAETTRPSGKKCSSAVVIDLARKAEAAMMAIVGKEIAS